MIPSSDRGKSPTRITFIVKYAKLVPIPNIIQITSLFVQFLKSPGETNAHNVLKLTLSNFPRPIGFIAIIGFYGASWLIFEKRPFLNVGYFQNIPELKDILS